MKKILVIGIIGCGYIADFYVENIKKSTTLKINSCFDINHKRLIEFANHYQIFPETNIKNLLNNEAINTILNLTPPEEHYKINKLCLLNGKNVYCEKPLTLSFEESKDLISICKEKKLRLWTAPSIIHNELSMILRKKFLPKLNNRNITGYAHFESPSLAKLKVQKWVNPSGANWPFKNEIINGPIIEHSGYLISILCGLFGPVIKVSSTPYKIISNAEKKLANLPSEKIGNNHCIATLFFKNNIFITLIISEKTKARRSLELYDENISLLVSDIRDDYSAVIYKDNRSRNLISSRDNRLHHIVRRISNFVPTFFAIPFLVSNPFSYNKRIISKKLDFSQLIKNQKPANFIKGLEALRLSLESKNDEYLMEDFFLHCNEVTLKLNQACMEDKFTSSFNHKKFNKFLKFID